MKQEPQIRVGILSAPILRFELRGAFRCADRTITGACQVETHQGAILWEGHTVETLQFTPLEADCSFLLRDVMIGIQFHWQRTEDQAFRGSLEILCADGELTAINRINVEEYLCSVIASEMSAAASEELLKAHAVISRSWLLSQILRKEEASSKSTAHPMIDNDRERIRWYDREDHTLYDVCADDHCQRYQGITRVYAHAQKVRQAIESTRGEVLTYCHQICDARFSKCCGGVTEEFQHCWEPEPHAYLTRVRDTLTPQTPPDLTQEAEAQQWIEQRPEACCNTTDEHILRQVLNDYDRETAHFYRWSVEYSTAELSDLIHRRTGIDFGTIQALVPLERGTSGRIVRLRVEGSRRTLEVGKELEIRKMLSTTHLYSSAFTVHHQGDRFRLQGAGWGHGVGLCQIGAAVMSSRGISYDRILAHYYPGSSLEQRYI